jgi:hypothetical protein
MSRFRRSVPPPEHQARADQSGRQIQTPRGSTGIPTWPGVRSPLCCLCRSALPRFPFDIISEKSPAVLVLMTINAKVLPVGAVRGIIPVVPVLMMHGEKVPVLGVEFSPAFGADEAVYPQGLLPVIGVGRACRQSSQLPNDLLGAFSFRGLMRLRLSRFHALPVPQTPHLSSPSSIIDTPPHPVHGLFKGEHRSP